MSYVALANVTLGGSTSSVTFSNISQGFRDLVLVVAGTNNSGGVFGMIRMNGDTGNNYNTIRMYNTTADSSTGASAMTIGEMWSVQSNIVVQVMDYSAVNKHKAVLSRSASLDPYVFAIAGRWANTSAVNSLTFLITSGTLVSGTTVSLYGIAA